MIKECEIKVENRGMADAQGWELTNSPIQTTTSSWQEFWNIIFYCIRGWDSKNPCFKVVVKENLQGEVNPLGGQGSLNSIGTGPVLWVYPLWVEAHMEECWNHTHYVAIFTERKSRKMRRVVSVTLRELGQWPYCGCLLKNVSPILLTCVWGSLKREVCL